MTKQTALCGAPFRGLSLALLVLLALSLVGCFRYTPSRSEAASSDKEQVAGPERFDQHQSELQSRLQKLIEQRANVATSQPTQDYKLGKGDGLKINVFGFNDLSGEMDIAEDGTILLPLIGSVQAVDRTTGDLQEDLTQRFKRYVRNPIVRVSVERFNAYRVSVVGAVVKPGFYPLKRNGYLLTELLSEVGGLKENASPRLYLIPSTPNTDAPTEPAAATKTAQNTGGVEIDLEELTGTLERPPIVVPLVAGDTVIVPEAGQFRVDGEVERPGSFPISRRTSTLSAVAAAGGFTYAANVNEVEVIRDIGAGKKAYKTIDLEQVAFHGGRDVGLRDGDVVIVPSSPGRFRARQLVEAFRSIMRGGVTGSIRYE